MQTTDPHATLGAHPRDGGVVVRAWRPDAERVTVRAEGGQTVELAATEPTGLFEGEIDGASLPLRYELDVAYPDGNTFTLRDPYAFPPTISELDLHLAGEGRHEELYRRLGAQVRDVDGVAGVSFAVWAPAAAAVAIVGDFNAWDGRVHPMRAMGASGIWELFVPGVATGARYKFEIRTPSGDLRMKADPFAFEAEVPPETSSIVNHSEYAWQDAEWITTRAEVEQLEAPISIYEVHLGSWRLNPLEDDRSLTYAELADELAAYAHDMGFTHLELLPVMAHPFAGS